MVLWSGVLQRFGFSSSFCLIKLEVFYYIFLKREGVLARSKPQTSLGKVLIIVSQRIMKEKDKTL